MAHRTWSRIVVVGAGAIGCYVGGMLARAGAQVTLIGRRRHVEAINRRGLLFQSREFEGAVPLAATEEIAAVRGADLVLFCVKSSDTEAAARAMSPYLAPEAIILSLQNGVDNPERIRRHVRNRVVPVLVYAAAYMVAPGCVRHTGGGSLVIGLSGSEADGADNDRPLLEALARLFGRAGMDVRISTAVEVDLWTKLVMNCAYNAISALGSANYARMVAMPEVRTVMREAVLEVRAVAQAKGIRLPDDIVEAALKLADAMPQTMSSMAQDLAQGRRTEIDHLNGFVVRQGDALGIPTPVNRTLHALIKLLEQSKAPPPG